MAAHGEEWVIEHLPYPGLLLARYQRETTGTPLRFDSPIVDAWRGELEARGR